MGLCVVKEGEKMSVNLSPRFMTSIVGGHLDVLLVATT